MRTISKIANNVLEKMSVNIPKEYKDELLQELLRINIQREKALSIILIVIDIILISLEIFAYKAFGSNKHIFMNLSYIHIILLIVPSIFLLLIFLNRMAVSKNISLYSRALHLLIIFLVLILCSLQAVSNELVNQLPFAYVIAMLCIASTVLLSLYERLMILFSYIIYIIGIFIVQRDTILLFRDTLFFTLLVMLALIVSNINYSASVKNFINKRTILKKNQELDAMYKITEEALNKRTEELNETMEYERLRTAFFANLSHELRTPLNVIFSAEQMLDFILKNTQIQGDKKEIDQYIHIIKQNCYRLIRLIANLIDITKIDAGYFQVNFKNSDIVKIVEDITLSVVKSIEDKDIGLTFDTDVEEKVIACDPDKIERIMLNLLSNAVKFTPEGGNIYVNVYEKENKIVIGVKDTGIGIPAEMNNLIFDRFVQVDKTISRNREGSGIGLSIVKSLVEMHSGKISLISEEGKGSEFIFEIPDRVVPDVVHDEKNNLFKENRSVEMINVEFSDIYN